MKLVIILITLILFVLFFLASVPYYSGDVKNHLAWAQSLLNMGPFGFYERQFPGFSFPNYPPLAMGLFAACLKLYELTNQIIWFMNSNFKIFPSNLVHFFQWENVQISFLKLPAIISNFGIAFAIYLLINLEKKLKKLALVAAGLFLFNPASFYLSVVWGQIDFLPMMFFLFSLYFIFKKKLYWSIILINLSFLSKQTIIILFPAVAYLYWKTFGIKRASLAFLSVICLIIVSYIPFHGLSLTWPFELLRLNFEYVAKVTSVNSLNVWGFLFDFKQVPDDLAFLGIAYHIWGQFLFVLFIIPILFKFFQKKITFENFLSVLTIVGLAYFFFLTRIHERYLAPVIALLTILAMINKKYVTSLLFFSFLYFTNLYKGLLQPDMLFFNSIINSLTSLKILVIGYFMFYMHLIFVYLRKNE